MTPQEQIAEFERLIKNTDPDALAVAWASFVDLCKLYPRACAPNLRLVSSKR